MKTILEVEVGSTAHGTGTGSDDLDLMRVVIEDAVIECRRGEMDRDWALAEITESQKRLKEAFLQSPLPETPNRSAVEAWMVQTYLDNWRRD